MQESYRFVVRGRVQGVFFRQSSKERADALGLRGWVRNRPDGAVEGLVAGVDAGALDAFRDWLRRGPTRAQVQDLDWSPSEETAPPVFEVRR